MSRLRAILLVAMLAITLMAPSLARAADSTYTVSSGDTLTSIAARYGVSVDAIVSVNGLSSANVIVAGQTLKIPGVAVAADAPAASTPASTASGGTYAVESGDSLYAIALRFDISVDALMSANGLTDRNFVYVGQSLKIPGAAATAPVTAAATSAPAAATAPDKQTVPANGTTYTVQSGDYLSAIASRYGVSLSALIAANNITSPDTLYRGMVLTIPGANTPANTPVPAATTVPATAVPATATAFPPTELAAPDNKGNLPDAQPDEGVKPSTPTSGETVEYVVQAGDVLYKVAAAYGTTVDAIVAKNSLPNANVLRVGQTLQVVVGDMTSKPALTDPNQPAKGTGDEKAVANTTGFTGKWIDVNVSTQRLTAYEGDTPVYNAIVSTGLSGTPTVIGTFKIYAKYRYDDMTGGEGADYYYLPDVPHTMYFYGGYAIHGAYWHTNFGRPQSHGCVNLSLADAEWIYNWTPMGTTVYTHW